MNGVTEDYSQNHETDDWVIEHISLKVEITDFSIKFDEKNKKYTVNQFYKIYFY